MRTIDATGLLLCRKQGEIFEQSPHMATCGSAIFIRRFMHSHVAERFDSGSYPFEANSIASIFMEIEHQYGKSRYGSTRYSGEELYWMGYLYRYWAYVSEMSSSRIYSIASARELRPLYAAYHTLDPEMAIERIAEAKGISLDHPSMKEQVKALRRIRKRLNLY